MRTVLLMLFMGLVYVLATDMDYTDAELVASHRPQISVPPADVAGAAPWLARGGG